jgi:DNA-binding SARP family transcriptional activator
MSDSLRLLGHPTVVVGGAPHALPAVKSGALAVYLGHQQRWVTRSELLFLLWPDVDQKRAGANLRQIIATVARTPWGNGLQRDGQRLWLPLDRDVGAFLEAADGGRHDCALSLYGGSFLEGFIVPDAPEFTAWADVERDTLHQRWRRVVLASCDERMAAMAFADAFDLARRLLDHDPLDEHAARRAIEASLAAGEVGQGIRTYRSLANHLRHELDADPSPATQDLARRLHDPGPVGAVMVAEAPESHAPGHESAAPAPQRRARVRAGGHGSRVGRRTGRGGAGEE